MNYYGSDKGGKNNHHNYSLVNIYHKINIKNNCPMTIRNN